MKAKVHFKQVTAWERKIKQNKDKTTIKDRKPELKLKSNHFEYVPVIKIQSKEK